MLSSSRVTGRDRAPSCDPRREPAIGSSSILRERDDPRSSLSPERGLRERDSSFPAFPRPASPPSSIPSSPPLAPVAPRAPDRRDPLIPASLRAPPSSSSSSAPHF